MTPPSSRNLRTIIYRILRRLSRLTTKSCIDSWVFFISFAIYPCTAHSHLQSFLCPFTSLHQIANAGAETCRFSDTVAVSFSFFIRAVVPEPNKPSSQFHVPYSFLTEQLRILKRSVQSFSVVAERTKHWQGTVHGQPLVELEQAFTPLLACPAKGSGVIARWTITGEAVQIQLLLTFSGITAYLDVRCQDFLASCDILDCVYCFSLNGIVPVVMDVGQA